VERDYAVLHDLLEESLQSQDLRDLIVQAPDGRVLAQAGWTNGHPPPPGGAELSWQHVMEGAFVVSTPIRLMGQDYGLLTYGLSTRSLEQTHTHLLHQSLAIALPTVLASTLVLIALGAWLTRHLARLTQAS